MPYCLIVLTEGALSVLQSLFLKSCRLHVTILKGSLILPSPGIGGADDIMQPLWEIIHLDVEFGHTIHVVHTFRVRSFAPHDLTLFGLLIGDGNLIVPVAFDQIVNLLIFTLGDERFAL